MGEGISSLTCLAASLFIFPSPIMAEPSSTSSKRSRRDSDDPPHSTRKRKVELSLGDPGPEECVFIPQKIEDELKQFEDKARTHTEEALKPYKFPQANSNLTRQIKYFKEVRNDFLERVGKDTDHDAALLQRQKHFLDARLKRLERMADLGKLRWHHRKLKVAEKEGKILETDFASRKEALGRVRLAVDTPYDFTDALSRWLHGTSLDLDEHTVKIWLNELASLDHTEEEVVYEASAAENDTLLKDVIQNDPDLNIFEAFPTDDDTAWKNAIRNDPELSVLISAERHRHTSQGLLKECDEILLSLEYKVERNQGKKVSGREHAGTRTFLQ